MRCLNLGIVAHVDAGKTTLTERLLYAAGIIDAIGSVDDGTTQTDTLALERQRGITIKAAVVSFVVGDATINLIDTPGHPDFIAEVERVLSVLDGAVLVVSAVEGVQAQTRVLLRTLRRLRIPTIIFVNKIDRTGADDARVLRAIAEKLTPAIAPLQAVRAIGTRQAEVAPLDEQDVAFRRRLLERLTEHDDALLAAYVDGEATITPERLRRELARQCRQAIVHPLLFGSAITGAGVDALIKGVIEFLPVAEGDVAAPVAGTVFKIERGPAGEKIAYARLFAGTLRTRDRLRFGDDGEAKVTSIAVFEHGGATLRPAIVAGQIGRLCGLEAVRVGDAIGVARTSDHARQFSPPSLETVVVPRRIEERTALRLALEQLAEQDPLINLRQDDVRQELSVSLYGEVQKEVVQATLANEYGIAVEFRETTTICIERPNGSGAAVEVIRQPPNPFLATVGLRVEPAPIGSGVRFATASEVHGLMPFAFFKAVEDTVMETLRQGLHGWQVVDCIVTMTHAGYAPRHSLGHQPFNKSMSSTGADFRGLTPLVLLAALARAGTTVYEPLHRFRIDAPADTLAALTHVLARLGGVPLNSTIAGAECVVEGEIAAAGVHALQQQLPALTRGEGVLEAAFDRYQPVRGRAPERPRADHNRLDRKEYLLHVLRRV